MRSKKVLAILLSVALLVSVMLPTGLILPTAAETTVVTAYVNTNADATISALDNPNAPYADLKTAIAALEAETADDRIVQLQSNVSLPAGNISDSHENLIIIDGDGTAEKYALEFAGDYTYLNGDILFRNVTVSAAGKRIYAKRNNITFGSGVEWDAGVKIWTGEYWNKNTDKTLPSLNVTIENGYLQEFHTGTSNAGGNTTDQSPGINYVQNGGKVSRIYIGPDPNIYRVGFNGNVNFTFGGDMTWEDDGDGTGIYLLEQGATGAKPTSFNSNALQLIYNDGTKTAGSGAVSTDYPTAADVTALTGDFYELACDKLEGSYLEVTTTAGTYTVHGDEVATATGTDTNGNSVEQKSENGTLIVPPGTYTVKWGEGSEEEEPTYTVTWDGKDEGFALTETDVSGIYTVTTPSVLYQPVVKDAEGNTVEASYANGKLDLTGVDVGAYHISWVEVLPTLSSATVYVDSTIDSEASTTKGTVEDPFKTLTSAIKALDNYSTDDDRKIILKADYDIADNDGGVLPEHDNLITIEGDLSDADEEIINLTATNSIGGPLTLDNIRYTFEGNSSTFSYGGFPLTFGKNAVYAEGSTSNSASGRIYASNRDDTKLLLNGEPHKLTIDGASNKLNRVYLHGYNVHMTIPGVNFVMNGGTLVYDNSIYIGASANYTTTYSDNVNVEINGGTLSGQILIQNDDRALFSNGAAVQLIFNNGTYAADKVSFSKATVTVDNLYVLNSAKGGSTLHATDKAGVYSVADRNWIATATDKDGNTYTSALGKLEIAQPGTYTVTWSPKVSETQAVQIRESDGGLRFISTVDGIGANRKDTYDKNGHNADYSEATITVDGVEYPVTMAGTLFARAVRLGNAELVYDKTNTNIYDIPAKKLQRTEVAPTGITVNDGAILFTAVIKNIPGSAWGEELIARAYVEYDVDGEKKYVYGNTLTRVYEDVLGMTNIALTSPADGEEVVLANELVYGWWKSYNWQSSTTISQPIREIREDVYYPVPVTLEWEVAEPAAYYTVSVSTNANMAGAKTYEVTESSLVLESLFVSTDYYWQVGAVYDDETLYSAVGHFKTANSPRTIKLDGVSNTRDIGGMLTEDGKSRIKQGMVYRGAQLASGKFSQRITEEAAAYFLTELGIKTDLDLRKPPPNEAKNDLGILTDQTMLNEYETGLTAYDLVLPEYFKWINVDGRYYLNETYGIQTDAGKAIIAKEIEPFADPDNYPIFFHCAQGRDRTGTLALLLEGLLGASKSDIMMDYEMYIFSYRGTAYEDTKVSYFKGVIEDTYDWIDTTYDGDTFADKVEAYLLSITDENGDPMITQSDIDTIRNQLLEPVE